jgi:hypothetical protein
MESYKRMRIPVGVDRKSFVVRDGIPDDLEWRCMRLEIHNRRYNIARALTPAGVEIRVNAKLLARCETKFGVRGHIPNGEASVVRLRVRVNKYSHRYTVGIL